MHPNRIFESDSARKEFWNNPKGAKPYAFPIEHARDRSMRLVLAVSGYIIIPQLIAPLLNAGSSYDGQY
jgi:hypothetical protein